MRAEREREINGERKNKGELGQLRAEREREIVKGKIRER